MILTPLEGFLAAMADSDFSIPFYVASLFQVTIFFLGISKTIRCKFWFRVLAGIALLVFPILLALGAYFAMIPVA